MDQWRPWPHQGHAELIQVHIVSKGGSGVEIERSTKAEMRRG